MSSQTRKHETSSSQTRKHETSSSQARKHETSSTELNLDELENVSGGRKAGGDPQTAGKPF